MNTEIIEKTCECGATFSCESERSYWPFCDKCSERRDEEVRRSREARAIEERRHAIDLARHRIDRITPDRYRATETGSPDFNLPLWQKIDSWSPTDERPWLGLVGPTGTCKTRCAFLLARDLAVVAATRSERPSVFNLSVETVTGPEFGRIVLENFSGDQTTAREAAKRIRELTRTSLLLFDELGKVRGTPAITEAIFSLLNHRHAENLCTIWTSNRPPEEFCRSWPEEFAGPTAGRIVECSTIVES